MTRHIGVVGVSAEGAALCYRTICVVLLGSLAGAYILARARTRLLRIVFSLVILLPGVEMIDNGLTGRL